MYILKYILFYKRHVMLIFESLKVLLPLFRNADWSVRYTCFTYVICGCQITYQF